MNIFLKIIAVLIILIIIGLIGWVFQNAPITYPYIIVVWFMIYVGFKILE
jgi:hypothetical protein